MQRISTVRQVPMTVASAAPRHALAKREDEYIIQDHIGHASADDSGHRQLRRAVVPDKGLEEGGEHKYRGTGYQNPAIRNRVGI